MNTLARADARAVAGIRDLFLPGTSIAWSAEPPAGNCLLPMERCATVGMATVRRQAFAHGRACAHRALQQLGYRGVAVPVGEQRAPLWPPGVTGSIAHCAGHAIAVAARLEVAGAVGVDIEATGGLEAEVLQLVCTRAERHWLERAGDASLARAIFAIKESVYKCLWPRVRRFIDFQEVAIDVNRDDRSYRARATGPGLDASVVAAIRGAYLQADGLLFASAYLPPAASL